MGFDIVGEGPYIIVVGTRLREVTEGVNSKMEEYEPTGSISSMPLGGQTYAMQPMVKRSGGGIVQLESAG